MAKTQKTLQELLPGEVANAAAQRALRVRIIAGAPNPIAQFIAFWALLSALRDSGACSASNAPHDIGRSLGIAVGSGMLLCLYTLWTDDQIKRYHAVKHHTPAQSTEPLQATGCLWFLPHGESPLRRILAIVASIPMLLLQLLALYLSYLGLWVTSVGVFRATFNKGTCVNGQFLLSPLTVRLYLGFLATLLVSWIWLMVVDLASGWLSVQGDYLSCLYTNDGRRNLEGSGTADQGEKAAFNVGGEVTEPWAGAASPST